jgi:hypothetical protein
MRDLVTSCRQRHPVGPDPGTKVVGIRIGVPIGTTREGAGMSVRETRHETVPDASRRDSIIELLLMLFAMGPVVVSAYASFVTGDGQWFQRSGALMVLFSVAVEYHRRRMPLAGATQRAPAATNTKAATRRLRRFWRSIPYVCYLSVFTGTLIWSYGDLLF